MPPKKTAGTSKSSDAVPWMNWLKQVWNDYPKHVFMTVWNGYWETTSAQTLLIDVFLAFLVTVGVIQAVYWAVGGRNVSAPKPQLCTRWHLMERRLIS